MSFTFDVAHVSPTLHPLQALQAEMFGNKDKFQQELLVPKRPFSFVVRAPPRGRMGQ